MDFKNLQAGTIIKFYNNWSDEYMIGEIIREKNEGYQVAIKSRLAKEIFVEVNDITTVIDKTQKFIPVNENIIEEEIIEIPLIEEMVDEIPIIEEEIIEEEIIEMPITKEPRKSSFTGLFSNGGIANSQLKNELPNELTIYIPLFSANENPASDSEIENRVDDVKDFLTSNFGEPIFENVGSSYIDREGNLVMRKTIQITAFPSDEEFNYGKKTLINQISLWASEWGQDFVSFEFEEDMFYILKMEDLMKQGGELWIDDAIAQMQKKGTIGAFTKQAKREGLTPIQFAKKVLKNPKGYVLKTRRRANFVKNANPDKF